jgi:hypothetical protein
MLQLGFLQRTYPPSFVRSTRLSEDIEENWSEDDEMFVFRKEV